MRFAAAGAGVLVAAVCWYLLTPAGYTWLPARPPMPRPARR
jgi:sigma54-dependent transcription regulator